MKIYKVEQSVNWEGTHQRGYFTNYPSVGDITNLGLYFTSPEQIKDLVETGKCTVSYYTVYSVVEQEVTEN
jgi:hypothetical protein